MAGRVPAIPPAPVLRLTARSTRGIGRPAIQRSVPMRVLFGSREQALGLLHDRSGEPIAISPCEPRKAQGAPLLGHGRGGIRPGQAVGGAQAVEQVSELGERRLYWCCRRCCGGGEQVKLAGGESAHSGSIAGNRVFQERHLAMTKSALQAVVQEMRSPQAGLEYYALTLTADEMGEIQWAMQSSFFGYKSRTPIIERRGLTHPLISVGHKRIKQPQTRFRKESNDRPR